MLFFATGNKMIPLTALHRRSFLLVSLVACHLSLLPGCDAGGPAYRQLAAENVELKNQLADARAENQRLGGDVQDLRAQRDTLMTIQGMRLEAIPRVASVELGKWTGGYSLRRRDGGGDGQTGMGWGHDAVKVYVIPRDGVGSVIKAAGSVTVRLFDLAAVDGANRLGQCEVSPEALASLWFTGLFMPDHYSIVCPFETPPQRADVTVHVEFTDYVTGKTFTQVTNVRVELP